LKPLYNYKLTGLIEADEIAREVRHDYKTGITDPTRDAAMQEKVNFIKKKALKFIKKL